MKTFITSDLHFEHKNILKYSPLTRGQYKCITEMREDIIAKWNSKVAPKDLVYILGDVAFCTAKQAAEIMGRLNGKKILVIGNHDEKLVQNQEFCSQFIEVTHYKTITHKGVFIVMSHFPFLQWDRMHRGSVHFYGHLHGKPSGQEAFRCKDVGMDATGEVVVSLDSAVAAALEGQVKPH